jgi:hypothetical protein
MNVKKNGVISIVIIDAMHKLESWQKCYETVCINKK